MGREIVLEEFVLAGKEAVVTIVTFSDIDDQVPLFHAITPSYFSISTRQELGAIPHEYFVMKRLGVRMLIQPLRSGDSPGIPMGSYSAQDS